MNAKDEIKIIRKYIKAHVPTVSVTMGIGTAWGWIDIYSKDKGAPFSPDEFSGLRALGFNPGSNWDVISPEERHKLAAELEGRK